MAKLYGEDEGVEAAEAAEASNRSVFPMVGAGVQFILKPVQRMLVNLEYAQGVEGNHGVYLKFGYAW